MVGSMSQVCLVCQRSSKNGTEFCSLHNIAFMNLEYAYSFWSKAFGSLSRDEYYSRLEHLPETGEAVKKVIQHLREQ
jgi:hypothetical protein